MQNYLRNLLKEVAKRAGTNILSAVDYLDDESTVSIIFIRPLFSLISVYQIQLRVEIDETTGSSVLDFQGTGSEVGGTLKVPISIVHPAVIYYCMLAMLDLDISLNAGCLVPLESN